MKSSIMETNSQEEILDFQLRKKKNLKDLQNQLNQSKQNLSLSQDHSCRLLIKMLKANEFKNQLWLCIAFVKVQMKPDLWSNVRNAMTGSI